MKLYNVHLWDDGLKMEEFVLIAADSEEEAETKALDKSFLACAEAEEVNEINGYKVKFERGNNMLKKSEIKTMTGEQIIALMTEDEYEMAMQRFVLAANFCERYHDAAMLSNSEEYYTPGEFIKKFIEVYGEAE